jgi:hypothetical protein
MRRKIQYKYAAPAENLAICLCFTRRKLKSLSKSKQPKTLIMASPLTLYVQIKQDSDSQGKAQFAVKTFAQGVSAGLNKTQIVHYATLALVPNMPASPGEAPVGYAGILLMTDFDLAMNPYLETFWNQGEGIKLALQGLASIAFSNAGTLDTLTDFENFINKNNLTGLPFDSNFYQAYPLTVKQIKSLTPAS